MIREALELYTNGEPSGGRRLLFVGAGASGDNCGIALAARLHPDVELRFLAELTLGNLSVEPVP